MNRAFQHSLTFASSLACVFLLPLSAIQAQPTPSALSIPRVAQLPKIDGVLSPSEWSNAAEVQLRYQTQPGNNVAPSERTRVWLAMDSAHLYVAAEAEDREARSIRGRIRPRDELNDEDTIWVTIDTFRDRRRAYMFVVNPAGVQADGIFTEGAGDDFSWNGIFASAGRKTANGFVVELAIPFRTLRFRSGTEELVWGVHLERIVARRNEKASWVPIDRKLSGYLIQAGEIRLRRDGIERASVADVIPTITGLTQSDRTGPFTANRLYKAEPGFTVNMSLTPNLTISGAVNPDFSQVETDIPLAGVNQRFELFFPERRPFFLEGGEIFRPLQEEEGTVNLVNTRRIIDPDMGVKLTGKLGRFNVGYLAASDRAARMLGQPGSPASRTNAQFHIGRLQRDLWQDSAVGAAFTLRSHAGESNTVAAGDYRLRLGKKVLYYGQHIGSRTVLNPLAFDAASLPSHTAKHRAAWGQAHVSRVQVDGEKWFLLSSVRDLSSNLRLDSGFLPRAGFTNTFHNLAYRIRPDRQARRYVELRPQLFLSGIRTRQGQIDEAFVDPSFLAVLPRAVTGEVFYSFSRDYFGGRSLRYRYLGLIGSAAPYRRWSADWSVFLGGAAFFGDVPQVGRNGANTSVALTVRPTTRLTTEIRHIHSSLRSRIDGTLLFNQNIWRERTTFQFNRSWSIRSITEYNNDGKRRLGISQLLTYLPSPNTAVYVGYNDLLANPVNFNNRTQGMEDRLAGWNRQRQVFFIKLTYNVRI